MDTRRLIAVKTRIGTILQGQFVKDNGDLPNHVLLRSGDRIGRINIIGTLIELDNANGYQTGSLEDGTGRITIRAFEQLPSLAERKAGDIVWVIGKLREFNKEIYILPEVVKQITDTTWIQVRNQEIGKEEQITQEKTIEQEETITEQPLITIIRTLDKGDGADYDQVLTHSNKSEEDIQKLISEGQLFLIKPGRIKVLE